MEFGVRATEGCPCPNPISPSSQVQLSVLASADDPQIWSGARLFPSRLHPSRQRVIRAQKTGSVSKSNVTTLPIKDEARSDISGGEIGMPLECSIVPTDHIIRIALARPPCQKAVGCRRAW